jgi:hypothetical protein
LTCALKSTLDDDAFSAYDEARLGVLEAELGVDELPC